MTNQVHRTFPNLSEPTPICQIVEIVYNRLGPTTNNQNPAETKQINPYRLKSSRDHEHLPKQTEPQLNRQIAMKSMQTRPDPLTQRIDHRITTMNTQAARYRQLHKIIHIAQNNQHLI